MRHSVVCFGMVLVLGCADGGEPGELDNGAFAYACVSARDVACDGGTAQALPDRIALGGEFQLSYDGEQPASDGDVSFALAVRPAAPSFIAQDGDVFTAVAPGYVAMLARSSNDVVADLFHLRLAAPAELEVTTGTGQLIQESVDLVAPLVLTVRPRSEDQNLLAGSLTYEWTVADAAMVELDEGADDLSVTLVPLASGSTELTITGGGVTRTIDVSSGAL